MQTCAVIAEYDPFHKGHQYLLHTASHITGLPVISLMSGCFLQRGTASVQDKYIRAEAAVLGGSAAAFELPTVFATGSARDFAEGAVRLLGRSGVVTHLAFGVESESPDLLPDVAEILSEEPPAFQNRLKDSLKQGLSFPAAREAALLPFFPDKENELIDVLRKPNHVLAIEYLRAIRLYAPEITPLPIPRCDSGYLSLTPKDGYACAGAIRNMLRAETDITPYIPEELAAFYKENPFLLDADKALTPWINYLLLRQKWEENDMPVSDLSDALRQRIRKLSLPLSYSEILDTLKEKNETRTRVARALIHLLLNIRKDTLSAVRQDGADYINLLSFRESESAILRAIKEFGQLTVITKKADFHPAGLSKTMWEIDCMAAELYGMLRQNGSEHENPVRSEKSNSEFTQSVRVIR